jgi:hypothetical protein
MENHGQALFAGLTYLTGAIMVLILLGMTTRHLWKFKMPIRQQSSAPV